MAEVGRNFDGARATLGSWWLLWAVAAVPLGLSACGGTSDPGGNNGGNDPDPTTTPVGTPNGAVATQSIGAAGGTLTSTDGTVTITVPAGALATPTDITIQPVTPQSPGAVGTAYRLGPEGVTFTTPVTLSFHYADDQILRSAPELLWVASQDAAGAWRFSDEVVLDKTARTVTVTTTHFSDWTLLEGWQIRPEYAEVDPGARVALQVKNCLARADDVVYAYDCDGADPDPDLVALPGGGRIDVDPTSWQVNGDAGGSATYGFIEGTDAGGEYIAPSDAPDDRNPVAVSVRLKTARGTTVAVLNANIRVKTAGATYHAVGGFTRTYLPIAVLVGADITDKLDFDFSLDDSGGLLVSGITNFPSAHTNDRLPPGSEGSGICSFTLDSPYEYGTFDTFVGGNGVGSEILIGFSGDGIFAASTYHIADTENGGCPFSQSYPGGTNNLPTAYIEVDPALFPSVGSEVVILGTEVDGTTPNGWAFSIKRTH
jgi:hypothetical protein